VSLDLGRARAATVNVAGRLRVDTAEHDVRIGKSRFIAVL
jgi:hypothetical protein